MVQGYTQQDCESPSQEPSSTVGIFNFIFPKDSQISDCPPRKMIMEDNLMCFCHKKQQMR